MQAQILAPLQQMQHPLTHAMLLPAHRVAINNTSMFDPQAFTEECFGIFSWKEMMRDKLD